MVRYSLLFLVIALIATIESLGGFSVSVIPGWHTVIVPPFMMLSILLLLWLCLLPVGYLILERKNNTLTKRPIVMHLMLTLFYFFYSNGGARYYYTPVGLLLKFMSLAFFAIGQVIFIIYFVRTISSNPK
jgi:uncharacterized membrane protein YtjA (UPF0391 family)